LQVGHINGGNRCVSNWKKLVDQKNHLIGEHRPTRLERLAFQSSMNSYLGILAHHDTHRLRCRVLGSLDQRWTRFYHPDPRRRKLVVSRAGKTVGRVQNPVATD
jgi:hypothetical protein